MDAQPGEAVGRAETIHDSARTALAAIVALFAARLLKLPESFWAPISAIVIMQSILDPLKVGWQRFVGTAMGAVLGAALATISGPNVLAYGAGIFVCGMICWLLRVGNAYRFACITLSIVFLIARDGSPWVVAEHRFIEVSLGIAVALAMTRIWPAAKTKAA
jgi:uncharacterized membrane protein YgaE (UPF0421/DUF939 family)